MAENIAVYLKAFETFEQNGFSKDPFWLKQVRKQAMETFEHLGFPTMKDEAWKYTNVTSIARTQFQLAGYPANLGLDEIKPFLFGNPDWQRLVFINGNFSKDLSLIKKNGGLTLVRLSETLAKNPESVKPYLFQSDIKQNAFTALNAAFFHDGAFVHVAKNTILEEPIHLLFISTSSDRKAPLNQVRNLIVLEEHGKASVIEKHVCLGAGDHYLNNSVTEIILKSGSDLSYHKLEHESERSSHIGTTQVNQSADSKFSSSSITIDGGLVRNDLNVILNGEHSECALNGFYLVSGSEHVDNHTLIDHPKPNGKSHQVYKGILAGKSSGVFSGKILVHQDSQKTDASQINKNLLLSKEATMNTKPQLEILADDVKCTHGAAVGQLEEDAIFYLKTRGIDEQAASRLLSYGFASEVIDSIQIGPVREELGRIVRQKLEDCFAGSAYEK